MFDFLKDVTVFGFWVFAFVSFGLPVILTVLYLFGIGFQRGGLFSWKGRMNRLSFVVHFFVIIFVSTICGFLWGHGRHSDLVMAIFILVAIMIILRSMVIIIRRLHDFGVSGVFYFIWLAFNIIFRNYEIADLVGLFAPFVLALVPGNNKENKYGEIPKNKIDII